MGKAPPDYADRTTSRLQAERVNPMAQRLATTKTNARCSLGAKPARSEYRARHSSLAVAAPSLAPDDHVADAGPDVSSPELRELVQKAAMSAGAIGVPGALSFGLDVTAISAIWITMTLSIARRSGHKELSKDFVTKLVLAVVAGAGTYITGSKLASKALLAIPVGGTVAAIGVNSFLNCWFTLRLGNAVIELFTKPQFDADDLSGALAHCLPIMKQFPKVNEVAAIVNALRRA